MISTEISNILMKDYGHYVQAINYPTVPRGEEKLRVAPTPHHTKEMMNKFVEDLTEVWQEVGMELRPRVGKGCPQGGVTCTFCQKPLFFEELESRVKESETSCCQRLECPQLASAAA